MLSAMLEYSAPLFGAILLLCAYHQKNYAIRVSCLLVSCVYFLNYLLIGVIPDNIMNLTAGMLIDSSLAAAIWVLRGPQLTVALLLVYVGISIGCIVSPSGWLYGAYEAVILSLDLVLVTSLGVWPLIVKRSRRRFDHLPDYRTPTAR